MSFLMGTWLGVRVWIWLYFVLSIIAGVGVVIYWFREKIRKQYLKFRFPEKLLRVVVHYPSGLFNEYWRVIPDDDTFTIEGKKYRYVDKTIISKNDFYVTKERGIPYVKVDKKRYKLTDFCKIKSAWGLKHPEVHYWFNIPHPIEFNFTSKDIKLSSEQMEKFAENDLFRALLTLDAGKSMLILVMAVCVINLLATVFVIAKLQGWLK